MSFLLTPQLEVAGYTIFTTCHPDGYADELSETDSSVVIAPNPSGGHVVRGYVGRNRVYNGEVEASNELAQLAVCGAKVAAATIAIRRQRG